MAPDELIHHLPAFIQVADPTGKMEFVNQHWVEYTGIGLAEAQGLGWLSAIHPEDRESALQDWQDAVSSGRPTLHESRVRRFDGQYRWFLHRNVPISGH